MKTRFDKSSTMQVENGVITGIFYVFEIYKDKSMFEETYSLFFDLENSSEKVFQIPEQHSFNLFNKNKPIEVDNKEIKERLMQNFNSQLKQIHQKISNSIRNLNDLNFEKLVFEFESHSENQKYFKLEEDIFTLNFISSLGKVELESIEVDYKNTNFTIFLEGNFILSEEQKKKAKCKLSFLV